MNYFSFYKDGKALYCLIFIGMMLSFPSVSAKILKRSYQTFPQKHSIQGTVTDGSAPLPGVTIAVKSKPLINTITDYNGHYTITAAPNDTLVVSFIGFKKTIVPVQNRTKIDIRLQYDTTTLQEVKVNAGYYSVTESERTGSIAKITSKDIEKQPVSNVLATMQGRMAGVDIIQDSGTPGTGFQIKIRGMNSLREDGNQPLYIIDGVPYSSDLIGYSNTNSGVPTSTGPLNSINPNDIESIEVLKDADATSIYGSRGANGVVLITTKKGKAGKTSITLNASTGAGWITAMVPLMNTSEYLEMRRQAFANDGIASYPAAAYDINGTWDQNRYTNWQKELLGGTSAITNLQASIAGGSDLTQFLLSGTYRTETTVLPGDFGYDKGAVHFNMNHSNEDKKFKLSFSAGYTFQNNLQPGTDLTRIARTLAPNAPALYDSEGNLNFENNTFRNPLAQLRGINTGKINDLVANAVLSYSIMPHLEIKANLGFTDLKNSEQRLLPSTMNNPALNIGSSRSSIYTNLTSRQSWIMEPQIRWFRDFKDSSIDILIGGTAQQQSTARLYQSGKGFASNSQITDLSAAVTKSILTNDEILYKYQAFFGRVNYNFKEKYILNLTARRDGSSRFGPGRQFATFGAAGAAWLFSKEDFIKDDSFLSFGKLRASYGTTGSDQIGDYQFMDTYTTSGNAYNGIVGMDPTRLFNPNFSWEINRKFEIALETGFFHDRLFFTAAGYRNRSSNQLVGIPLPATTGFSSVSANLDAVVENSGLEFTLRTINFNNPNFKWSTNFNITVARNRLISFPGLEGSTYSSRYVIGRPTTIAKTYQFNGVNPSTGIYEFEDVNKDGIISIEDRQTIVDLTPQYYGGLQNTVQYKRLKLDFLFQFVKQQNYDYSSYVPGGSFINQPQDMVHSWKNQGDITTYQINTSGQNSAAVNAYYNYSDSNAGIVDASYIRLKNISLIYDLPLKAAQGVQCRLSLQGQNLLTFTPYKNGDPEFRFSGYLPPLQIFTAGIQMTF
ncbi:SusC/RagA family TonB-linked outer membrane protein [Flavobacterium tructae]|uniref:SusC/RagA family protein n=1 Tax=Flavobacterium tructae TaxID=1114873 RepID=A0A1S1J1J3_9FLAO|nr:SusC/RagA family TonB-linked outer membrane protein [Flavobacterium tructae]OHT43648.1 SusC/RagA family protein [Flavobacterium tructae]OXB15878.1 SusC/RagA family protein [Flavobacterium tructae]